MRMTSLLYGLALIGATGCAGSAYAGDYGPPPTRVEVITVTPGSRYVWVPGYWDWRSRQYFWVLGRWAVPPRGHSVWVPSRWERRNGNRWYFVRGRWR